MCATFFTLSKRRAANPATGKKTNKLPVTIALEANDLDPATRAQLEALFRQQAKKKLPNHPLI